MRESGSTSYNESNLGLSVMSRLFSASGAENIYIFKKAFLNSAELRPYKSLLISSPMFSPSAREATVLQEFVRSGGHLILFMPTMESLYLFQPLLGGLNISPPALRENEDFKNKEPEKVRFLEDNDFVSNAELYAVYSPIQFEQDKCSRQNRGGCFFSFHMAGSGQVMIALGVPVFSNTLLGREQNARIAFRLLKNFAPLAVDEYHHLFSQYTFWDLLKTPQFIVPMAGFLGLMLAFFLYARSPLHDEQLPAPEQPLVKGFHALSSKIIYAQLKTHTGLKSALKLQIQILKRLFPAKSAEIDALTKKPETTPLALAKALIGYHKLQQSLKRGTKS